MTNTQRRYTSRSNRPNKPNRTNKILNALIGLVIVLIVITGGIIFLGNDDADQANSKDSESQVSKVQDESTPGATGVPEADDSSEDVSSKEIETDEEDAEKAEEDEAKAEEAAKAKEEAAKEKEKETTKEDSTTGGTVTSTPSDDPIVAERVVNTAWKPVGTTQTGVHASVYSEGHVDWDEKIKAITYTTGLSADNMIVWIIQNGGGPQKSIGVVSSKNKEEKYRVYLQWVDGQGWKPEKMETLKTLDGAY